MIDNKLTHKPDDTPVLFINFRDEEFIGYWDKKDYHFAPHESKWLPAWLHRHFKKSIVDDEMNERKLATDHSSRSSFEAKCGGDTVIHDESNSDPLGIEALNKNKQAEIEKESPKEEPKKESKLEVKKKGGRPKKVESEFEG